MCTKHCTLLTNIIKIMANIQSFRFGGKFKQLFKKQFSDLRLSSKSAKMTAV